MGDVENEPEKKKDSKFKDITSPSWRNILSISGHLEKKAKSCVYGY